MFAGTILGVLDLRCKRYERHPAEICGLESAHAMRRTPRLGGEPRNLPSSEAAPDNFFLDVQT